MPVFEIIPLSEHLDNGFGAIALTFERAADHLDQSRSTNIRNDHIPVGFLLRHAAELYLKSLILLVHRMLRAPYVGEGPPFEPRVWENGRPQSLFRVHKLGTLFDDLDGFLPVAEQMLQAFTKVNWRLSPECRGWIELIDDYDARGMLFRYPDSRNVAADAEKDSTNRAESREGRVVGVNPQPAD
jgi:hypothetical protein